MYLRNYHHDDDAFQAQMHFRGILFYRENEFKDGIYEPVKRTTPIAHKTIVSQSEEINELIEFALWTIPIFGRFEPFLPKSSHFNVHPHKMVIWHLTFHFNMFIQEQENTQSIAEPVKIVTNDTCATTNAHSRWQNGYPKSNALK